jgi:hypothetical protein
VRAYTRKLRNLGCYSTQRNEKFHETATKGLHVHLPLRKSVKIICERIRKIGYEYDRRVNKQREENSRLTDKVGF